MGTRIGKQTSADSSVTGKQIRTWRVCEFGVESESASRTDDDRLYQGVFGKAEVERERPMTADAIFRIASVTKPVTSVAAMQLYERGLFAYDDPAEKGPTWE